MKGVIATCLAGLVKDNFGREKWEDALEDAGMDRHAIFSATNKMDDAAVMKVVASVCKVLNITPLQAADAFGDYWVNVYAPRLYGAYFQEATSAKELLLGMDKTHEIVTSTIPNAHPPRFEYEWRNSRTLIMKYRSHRGLVDFLVGLIKGVGKHFHEDLRVKKLNNTDVEVVFLNG
ncbi:MAG: heme NO-binding domain-containing protein [Candidatus Electrothrix sp. Rat3]|nr:heme NO-binding domain-containing protein [Candidatus Electrothrix rattekaaiensis]